MSAPSRPALLAGLAAFAVAAFAAWTSFRITSVVLDETVYKFVAARYADGLGAINGDSTSRGVARLYSLLIAPIFAVFEGDVAVRIARSLNGVLFALTALPVHALARRAGASRPHAAIAAAAAVAVPWATLATILFTESLAYLLFACTALAMLRLLEAPSLRREALVLVLLGALVVTRMQFLAVAVGWVALLAFDQWRARAWPWRRFPLTFGLAVVALLVILVRPRTVTGPYYGIKNREAYAGDFGLGALWEVEMLALGVGIVPALLAAGWVGRALGGALRPGTREMARLALVLAASVFAGTLLAQGGFLDLRSEERYFIYVVPLIWAFAAAALADGGLPARWLGWTGVGLAVVFMIVPNPVGATGEQMFLGPVSGVYADMLPGVERSIGDVLGVTTPVTRRDLLGLLTLALTAVAVWGWRRGGAARTAILVPALTLQVAIAVYAFTGIHGGLTNIDGLTSGPPFAQLGWIDRGTAGGPDVRLLDNQGVEREALQRETLFWNDEVNTVFRLPELELAPPAFPLETLPAAAGRLVAPLRLDAPPPGDLLLSAVDSPHWQLDADETLRSPDGRMALVRPTAELRWLARGLDYDGQLVRTIGFAALGGHRVEIDLRAPREDDQQALATVRLAGRAVPFDTRRARRTVARFDLCDRPGVVEGQLELVAAVEVSDRRFSGALVRSVRVSPCR